MAVKYVSGLVTAQCYLWVQRGQGQIQDFRKRGGRPWQTESTATDSGGGQKSLLSIFVQKGARS